MQIGVLVLLWVFIGIILVITRNKINKENDIIHWGVLGPLILIVIIFDYINSKIYD